MKIALIHVKENFTPVPPLGILYVATLLKQKGHDVHVFDVTPESQETTIKRIKDIDPELVGFSAMTTSYSITKEFNTKLREQVPDAYYCWGGVHATAVPINTIEENNLDFLVYREGELTMVEVCEKIRGKKAPGQKPGINLEGVKGVYYVWNGKIIQNEPRPYIEDLDSLPFPDRSLLENFEWYLSPPGVLRGRFQYGITTIYTSRGCPYGCIFCSSKLVLGNRIRQRSVANVLAEIRYLKENFGVTGVCFNDDTFATNEEWVSNFCSAFKRSGLNMIWGCQTRANYAQNFRLMKMLVDAGCVQIDIGCESGSDKVLRNLRKGITREMILKSLSNLSRLKVEVFATFILGNPGETLEDVEMSIEVAKKVPGGVIFLILTPYPGSPLYDMAVENKWFTDNIEHMVFDERWSMRRSDEPVMEASFKVEELVRLRAKINAMFLFKTYSSVLLSFIKNPYYLYRIGRTIVTHPIYVFNSARNAIIKRDIFNFFESVFHKFNEDLRKGATKKVK